MTRSPAILLKLSAVILAATCAPVCRGENPLEVRLVSEVASIKPGQPFYAGLLLHHGKGHHSYWKFPGIVGVPTSIKWNLPPGFVAGEIEWPEPQRVLMFQIKAQGFKRDVLLPVKITPPANLAPGTTITLQGRAAWMSCANVCNPGFTDVRLELPVLDSAPEPDQRWQAVFEEERARQPKTTGAWTATAVENGAVITLTLKPATTTTHKTSTPVANDIIFFTEDGWIDSDQPQQVQTGPDGALSISLRISDYYLGKHPPAKLMGILQTPQSWLAGTSLRSIRIAPVIQRQ